MNSIEKYIKNTDNFNRPSPVPESGCVYEVYTGEGRYSSYSACGNKEHEVIQGYNFCKQHAFIVKAKLGEAEQKGCFYQVSKYTNQILEIPYSKQTEKTYWDLRGNKIFKESRLQGELFDTEEEAKQYLINRFETKIMSLEKDLEKTRIEYQRYLEVQK